MLKQHVNICDHFFMITCFTTYKNWAHREESTISNPYFFINITWSLQSKIKKLQERMLKRHMFNTVQIACSHSNDRSKLNDQHNRQRPIRWTRESSLRQMTKISSLRAPITTRRSAMASISISRDFPYRTAKIGELRRCKSNNLRAHSTHIIIITTATWLRRWNGKKATCRRRGGYPKKLSDMNEWRNEWMVLTRHLIKGSLIPLGEWLRSKYPYISLTPSN